MKPTDQQQAAIEIHDKNIIVVAGAGSGKTFVLVQRFLVLLDANPDWTLNTLVAITFTRKAAGEMRDRVRQGLQGRYQSATTREERRRWSAHLSAMDSARIDTIHGLCGNILRANAAEARLDPQFQVVDEVESLFLLQNAVDDALSEVGNTPDHPSAPLFNTFSEYQIRNALNELYNADLPDHPADLMALWRGEWEKFIVEAAHDILNDGVISEWLTNAPFITVPPEDDRFVPTWLEARRCAEKLGSDVPEVCADGISTLADKSRISFVGGSAAKWGGKEQFALIKDWLKQARSLAENALKAVGDPLGEADESAAQFIPMWVYLVQRVKALYRTEKEQQFALDFDDLEVRTLQLLTDFPHVAERYRGVEFKHLLVDEFQDTNSTQWEIVKALAGLYNPGSMFVVGDPKQSIYAFRGADVSVFEDVREEITRHGGIALDLSESRRTHKPLVDSFNHLFKQILVKTAGSPVMKYEIDFGRKMDAARAQPPQTHSPHIHLWEFEGGKAEPYRREEARIIAERIQKLVAEGHPVHDKATDTPRPIRYGDFALLFQAMTNANLYEEALRRAGVPYITVAGRGYYGRQEVIDLLNLLRVLHNRGDNLSLAAVLRSAMFGLSDDTLYALRLDTDHPILWDALAYSLPYITEQEQRRVNFAHNVLTELQRIAGRVTISELLRHALTLTGFMATLSGLEDGAQRRGNVEKLLLKAQSAGKITLSEFTIYLGELTDREVREGSAALEVSDVVQLMSVHKSKGLEFPAVILPDASRDERGGFGSPLVMIDNAAKPPLIACKVLDAEGKLQQTFAYRRIEHLQGLRDSAERRRLLYVAATRARDLLIISSALKSDGNAKGWMDWVLSAVPGLSEHNLKIETFSVPVEDENAPYAPAQRPPLTAWDNLHVRNAEISGEYTFEPAMLAEIQIQRPEQARHLAATSIADLGSAEETDGEERAFYRGRFRRKIMYDAPAVIKPLIDRQQSREYVSKRQIGEIVHTALQFWHFPDGNIFHDVDFRKLLMGYAWEQGIASEDAAIEAVSQALELLQTFQRSELYLQLEKAPAVYREMPFIYENSRFIVHGIIDVVFRQPDGTWVIVDYKTSSIFVSASSKRMTPTAEMLKDHARRYHLQVGIYAHAVQQQLVVIPETRIHYIRYGKTVPIPSERWQGTLQRNMGERIRRLIEDDAEEARSLTLNP